MTRIPKSLQPILWSANIQDLDLKRDQRYIIHQVLTRGALDDLRWLFDTYSKPEIIKVFTEFPSQIYPKKGFYFTKNFILGLKEKKLDEQAYVTSISGPVRSRATDGI